VTTSTKKKAEPNPAELSRQTLAEAQMALDEAKAEFKIAASTLRDLENESRAGRPVDPDEMVRAEAARRIAQDRKDYSEHKVKQAERNLVPDEFDVAEALAPIVSELVGEVIHIGAEWPEFPDHPTIPFVALRQARVTEHLSGGWVAGSVELQVLKPTWTNGLDMQLVSRDKLERAFANLGARVTVTNGYAAEANREAVTLKALRAPSRQPLIDVVYPIDIASPPTWVQALAYRAEVEFLPPVRNDRIRVPGNGTSVTSTLGGITVPGYVTASVDSFAETIEGVARRVKVGLTLHWKMAPRADVGVVEAFLHKQLDGSFVEGLGAVESVRVLPVDQARGKSGDKAATSFELAFFSRTSVARLPVY
jgi:hypothetical protein